MCNGIEYNVMFTCIEYELKKLKKKKNEVMRVNRFRVSKSLATFSIDRSWKQVKDEGFPDDR